MWPFKRSAEDYLKEQGVAEFGNVAIEEKVSKVEAESRLRREEADATAKRRLTFIKEISTSAVGILIIAALAIGAGLVIGNEKSSSDNQTWARSVLTALGGAVTGYFFGKGSFQGKE